MKKTKLPFLVILAVVATTAMAHVTSAEDGARKVILDSDMVELFDDGMAMLLLDKAPNIDLLGVTVVSGNTPMPRGMATGARQLEAIRSDVPIYAGSRYGIRNWRFDPEIQAAELAVSPVVSWPGYLGHYAEGIEGDPMADWTEVYELLYGEAPSYPYVYDPTSPDPDGNGEAVDFLVEKVNKYPGEVTIVAIGPLTNIARAIMQDPTFASKVKEIAYMGGSFYMPGNSSATAEFNWWADPDAAKISVRQQWGDTASESYQAYGNQMIAGLEANANTGGMPEDLYYQMVEDTYPGMADSIPRTRGSHRGRCLGNDRARQHLGSLRGRICHRPLHRAVVERCSATGRRSAPTDERGLCRRRLGDGPRLRSKHRVHRGRRSCRGAQGRHPKLHRRREVLE